MGSMEGVLKKEAEKTPKRLVEVVKTSLYNGKPGSVLERTALSYDDKGRVVRKVTTSEETAAEKAPENNALVPKKKLFDFLSPDKKTKTADPRFRTTTESIAYDAKGRVQSERREIKYADKTSFIGTEHEYDEQGRPSAMMFAGQMRETSPMTEALRTYEYTQELDGTTKKKETKDGMLSAEFTYDKDGREIMHRSYEGSSAKRGMWYAKRYNEQGQLIEEQRGQIIDGENKQSVGAVKFTYSPDGRTSKQSNVYGTQLIWEITTEKDKQGNTVDYTFASYDGKDTPRIVDKSHYENSYA